MFAGTVGEESLRQQPPAYKERATVDASLLDQLESEHRAVEGLLARLEEATEASEQQPLVEELIAALTKHMETEEADVYPELVAIDSELAEEAENEHRLIREGLSSLQDLIGKPGFEAAVEVVKAGIAHHVGDEERDAFPKLRETLAKGGS